MEIPYPKATDEYSALRNEILMRGQYGPVDSIIESRRQSMATYGVEWRTPFDESLWNFNGDPMDPIAPPILHPKSGETCDRRLVTVCGEDTIVHAAAPKYEELTEDVLERSVVTV